MKKAFSLISIILFAVVSLTFISCGDDDNGGEMTNNPLVGEWAEYVSKDRCWGSVYNFKANGEHIVTDFAIDSRNNNEKWYFSDYICKYSISGNTVTFTNTQDGKQSDWTYNWTIDVEQKGITLNLFTKDYNEFYSWVKMTTTMRREYDSRQATKVSNEDLRKIRMGHYLDD